MAVFILRHARGEDLSGAEAAFAAEGLVTRAVTASDGGCVPGDLSGVDGLVVIGGAPEGGSSGPSGPSGLSGLSGPDVGVRGAEVGLLRAALVAEVPVLGVREGAELLAVAAGGSAAPGPEEGSGWDDVGVTPAADSDPLFAGAAGRQRVPRTPLASLRLPDGAVVLASCDRDPVRAFRVGGSAWGIRFRADAWQEHVLGRFAALVAARAERTATRTFFTRRADAWEERFAYQTPAYEAAVARMRLGPGRRALDLGCGTGRAMPALRALVGPTGSVLGVDVTHAMLVAAARHGRTRHGGLLTADCTRLPLPTASIHGIFSAGLLDHLPAPRAALREWARVSAPDGELLLFHPSSRAERAARHGLAPSPDDLLAEPNLRPALRSAGWRLTEYEDDPHSFIALATLRSPRATR
ncbi:methyltransferase domain-containing protein [Streptomyces sp. NPDC002467]|uniref:methyltransferase domain-containing protein n=1 Tax=Streptomyces sp. NPDC002467 TaxID=3364647 RepID=UPI00368CAFC9